MVFPRRPVTAERVAEIHKYYKELESFDVKTADGVTLRGYFLPRVQGGRPAPAVLYFAGNAEEQSGFFLWSPSELPTYSLVGVDYRGYGASEGEPSETALKADALAVYDALAAKIGPDAPPMFYFLIKRSAARQIGFSDIRRFSRQAASATMWHGSCFLFFARQVTPSASASADIC